MAGAIIENMSTKKLVIVGVILLLFQAFAFMVGGLIGKSHFVLLFGLLCVTAACSLFVCALSLLNLDNEEKLSMSF